MTKNDWPGLEIMLYKQAAIPQTVRLNIEIYKIHYNTRIQWVKYRNSRTQWVPRRPPKCHILGGRQKKFSALTRRLRPPQTSVQVSANVEEVKLKNSTHSLEEVKAKKISNKLPKNFMKNWTFRTPSWVITVLRIFQWHENKSSAVFCCQCWWKNRWL